MIVSTRAGAPCRRRAVATRTLAAIVALAAASISAAQPRQPPPPPGPPRPFAFPAARAETLPNGLTVLVVEDTRQPLVTFTLVLRAGAVAQPAEKPGVAALAAVLLTKGTASRSAQDIARAIDQVGGSLDATADDDYTRVDATVLQPWAELGLDLLADVVMRPVFAQEELDRQRRQLLSALQVQYADPEYLATVAARRAVLGVHPYSLPTEGTPASVNAIARDDVVAFHKATFGPAGSTLAVAGDITVRQAMALAAKYLGGWSGASRPPAVAAPAPPTARTLVIDTPDAVQTQIRLATTAVARGDPDYLPLVVANQAFGGSFNSRLNLRLRANEGLTYGASSALDAMRAAGAWTLSTFTRTEETARAVSLVRDLVTEFRENPITDQELNESRSFLADSFPLRAETPGQVASRLLEARIYGLPDDYWASYTTRVRAVTAVQVASAVRRHVDPDRMVLVLAGKADAFAGQATGFGERTVIPLASLDLSQPEMQRPSRAAEATGESRTRALATIDAAAAALGGADALRAVKDVTVKGKTTVMGPGGPMEGESLGQILYPDKIKSTITLPMGAMVQAFDGQSGWMRMGPQAVDMPPAFNTEMQRGVLTAGGIGVLVEALDGRAEIQALDGAEVDGRPHDVVLFKKGPLEVTLFYDRETHLLSKVSYRSVTPQGAGDIEVVASDYRPVGSVKYPFQIVGYQDGQRYLVLDVRDVAINTGLSPDVFSKP